MSIGNRPGTVSILTPITVAGNQVTFTLKNAYDAQYFKEKLNHELLGVFLDWPPVDSGSTPPKPEGS
jgi:hypothetical protein